MAEEKPLTKQRIEELKYGSTEEKEKKYSTEELEQLRKRSENGEKLTEDEAAALHKNDNEKTIKDIDSIIRGVNDVFEKDYSFNEDNIKFTIKIKAPNIVQAGKIEALREQYLNGMGLSQTAFIFNAYDALATIRICGIDVPKELAVDENIYQPALEWLYEIDGDFNDWVARFHA